VRYWAASGRPGTDTAIDESQMKVGRRLAIKLLNASRFALGRLGDHPVPPISDVREPIDVDIVGALAELVREATDAFDAFDYARALERTEAFFWRFCDDYVELVKTRAYGDDADDATRSAQAALASSLSVLLRLFAPFLPFVTEEVWGWFQSSSVHTASWPTTLELELSTSRTTGVFDATCTALGAVRREKTASKRSMRTAVDRVEITDHPAVLEKLTLALGDLKDAGGIATVKLIEGEPSISVTLAEPELGA